MRLFCFFMLASCCAIFLCKPAIFVSYILRPSMISSSLRALWKKCERSSSEGNSYPGEGEPLLMFYFHMFFPRQWRRGVGGYWFSTSHRLRIRSLCHNSERVKYFPLLSSSLSLPLKIKRERVGWRQRRRERYNWEVRSTPENSFLSGAHNYDNKLLLLHIDQTCPLF